jgi:hypothetical protein
LKWTLSYDGCTSSSCSSTVTTTVTDARSFKTIYTFGAQFGTEGGGNEGLLLRRQSGGTGTTFLQDEHFTYLSASGHPYPTVLGIPAQIRGDIAQLTSLRLNRTGIPGDCLV